jgi:hypothetical protein
MSQCIQSQEFAISHWEAYSRVTTRGHFISFMQHVHQLLPHSSSPETLQIPPGLRLTNAYPGQKLSEAETMPFLHTQDNLGLCPA